MFIQIRYNGTSKIQFCANVHLKAWYPTVQENKLHMLYCTVVIALISQTSPVFNKIKIIVKICSDVQKLLVH